MGTHRLAPLPPRILLGLGLVCVSVSGCSQPADELGDGAGIGDRAEVPPVDDSPDPGGSLFGTTCFAADPTAVAQVAAQGTFGVGDFVVTIDDNGGLDVTHPRAPNRSLFASPADRALVSLAHVDFEVEEGQGSFTVDETVESQCQAARLGEVRSDGKALILAGSFDEAGCAAVTWRVELCQAGSGHLAFRVSSSDDRYNRVTLRAASEADERILGLGEQFPHDSLDLKGSEIPILSQEGGVGRGHTPISQAINLVSPGSSGDERTTYYAAPHYLTSHLRSLFLEDTEYAVFDFRADDVTEIRLQAPVMHGRILAGNSPMELIERFTEWAGRMPPLPEWVHDGAVIALARDLDEGEELVAQLRSRGAAIAAVWNQTWSGKAYTHIGEQVLWNWVQNPNFHPDWKGWVSRLQAQGIRTLCYVNSMLVDVPDDAGPVRRNLFQEAVAGDYLVKNAEGEPYRLAVTAFDVGLIDFTNEAAREWMKAVLVDEMISEAGCSGWMADFAEALPFDAQLASGVDAATYHNQYPVEWARLNREAIEEAGALGDVLIFNRAGAARSPAYSMLLWEGDQLTTWDKYDGLVSALHGLLNGGFSGIALNHSDTGGYTSLSLNGMFGYEREGELLARWTEMNAFTSMLRTHEGNQPGVNAQVYSDQQRMDHFARFTRVYRALGFYRRLLFQEAQERGWPVVRHLWLHYPNDPQAMAVDDQFLLGSEILVAPIKNKCWTPWWCPYNKEVYLPAGQWVHLWSGKVYGDASRGKRVTVKAPIGEPAVFYKRGSSVGATFVQNLRDEGIAVAAPR